MARKFWLSILLPVYNVETYLAECFESITQQVGDETGVQIVIVDDASTDGSWPIARALRDQYPQRVKLVGHDVNQGVSAARNRLLAEADGEYIWFVDPDDYLLPGALSALRVIVTETAPDLILCDYRKSRLVATRSFYGAAKQLSTDIGQLVTGVFKSRKMYCWLKISRRSLWADGPRFPDGKIFEDIATTPWLLLKARHFYYMPSPWIYYRRRTGSIMDSVKRKTGTFDARKHQDLAEALTGFKEALHRKLGQSQPSTAYNVSDFCAKEFVKTGLRFGRATHNAPSLSLKCYLDLFEKCAPLTFDHLTIEYLKRLRFVRYLLLKYALNVAKASQKSTEGDNGRAQ
jgi:glycosyltransferase involved in cell wall biosynthesis